MKNTARNKWIVTSAVTGLYLLSLFLPAFTTEIMQPGSSTVVATEKTWLGGQVLMLGWVAILDGSIAWYADIILIAALALYLVGSRHCFTFSFVAMFIALTAFLYQEIWNDSDPPELIASYDIGFYLWLLAFIVMFVASLLTHPDRVKPATTTGE